MLGGQIGPRFTDHAADRVGPGIKGDGIPDIRAIPAFTPLFTAGGKKSRTRNYPQELNSTASGVRCCQFRVFRFGVRRDLFGDDHEMDCHYDCGSIDGG